MGDLRLQIRGKIDDVDCIEWAFLRTNTASYAKSLGDEGDLGLGGYFDTQLARADNWTGLFAFLSAFLRGIRICRIQDVEALPPWACTTHKHEHISIVEI